MPERRINMTAAEIRAYQTGERVIRRKVKPQPDRIHDGEPYWFIGGYRAWHWTGPRDVLRMGGNPLRSPFGQPGDRLVLREAWKPCNWAEGDPMTIQFQDGGKLDGWDATEEWTDRVYEQACIELDAKGCEVDEHTGNYIVPNGMIAWRPAQTMPRWAARYAPTVRTVRVEQIDGVWWWVAEVEDAA